MNYIISHEAHFSGVVAEYHEDDYIMVTLDNGETVAGNVDTVYVPLQAENADSMTHFDVGDKVTVYYDEDEIKTSNDGVQTKKVYAILLTEPANMENNNKS